MSLKRSVCGWACLLLLSGCGSPGRESGSGWHSLFDGRSLEGWDVILAAAPDGEAQARWNEDPQRVFSVVEIDGAPAVRISGQKFGALTSRQTFGNFHLRLEVKWGAQRWPPRATLSRDSGILYAAIGAPNPATGWMISVECNIMERGIGQWWSVNGAICDVEGEWITPEMEPKIPYRKEGDGERNIVFRPGAAVLTPTPANGITPPFDDERPHGEWNTVEVYFLKGKAIHVLNGRVNLIVHQPRYRGAEGWIPLRHGRIQLQSEGAECYFRQIRIREIDAIPASILASGRREAR